MILLCRNHEIEAKKPPPLALPRSTRGGEKRGKTEGFQQSNMIGDQAPFSRRSTSSNLALRPMPQR
jgi:hypothetical protein